MGIYVHMSVSKTVTKREWEGVYEETLQLVKAFPLAEKREVNCRGVETICLVPTKEREIIYDWNDKEKRIGWCTNGDYNTMHTAETYTLYRDMVSDDGVDENAGDALLDALPSYLTADWVDKIYYRSYSIWDNKTQGEPYHMYLLAIACLIESRLGEKAFVYGDITRGQCRKAVELANQHLEKTIDIPARCDMDRFFKRVSKLPIGEKEQLAVFDCLYLGRKSAEYGEYLRSRYSEELFDEYWKNKLGRYTIGTKGFSDYLKNYLLWGFDLRKLCSLVNYNDKNNIPQYDKFVKRILDAKLHIKDKNCEDMLEIDQEEEEPYTVYSLMAHFAFMGAENLKVDRYIPIEDIRTILDDELGDACNVKNIIDEYLREESQAKEIIISSDSTDEEYDMFCKQDASEVLRQTMNMKEQDIQKEREKYDIITNEELQYYKEGDKISPELKKILKSSVEFYSSIAEEEKCKILMGQSAEKRCEWLVEQNRMLLMRDCDWNKIFADIEENEHSFLRYYPMVRIELKKEGVIYLTKAIVLNDALYEFCKGI